MVKIIKTEGYDDGYYWDFRVWFEYNGESYTYIDVGSASGYIPTHVEITRGLPDLLKDWHMNYFFRPAFNEYDLVDAVKQLEASGGDTLEL